MRVLDHGTSVVLWASARDTEQWATRARDQWPCSELRGKRFCAAFDTTGLYELTVDGKRDADVPIYEFNAITADLLSSRLDKSHPVWFVTVGQFEGAA